MHLSEDIEQTLLQLLAARAIGTSIWPSEIARALDGERDTWRTLMPSVRIVAARLALGRVIDVTQRGQVVDIAEAIGPVRLQRGEAFPAPH